MHRDKKFSEHGNVFEGKVRSGVYGIRVCAIKFVPKSKHIVEEGRILTKLGTHTHVISIIESGSCEEEFLEFFYLVLDKCHEHNLEQHVIHQRESEIEFNLSEALEYSKQIIAGVMYVHEKLIIHKDLKPANILLSLDKRTIKLADFGISQEIKSWNSKIFCKTQFGTNGYRPPESYGDSWISLKSDIFSLGVVLCFVMSNGKSPFGDDITLWNKKTRDGQIDLPDLLVSNVKTLQHLLKLMLDMDRCRRPSIWQVDAHPCWTGNDVESSIGEFSVQKASASNNLHKFYQKDGSFSL